MERQSGSFTYPQLHWFFGVVEDRKDPKKNGRVRVRMYGLYSGDPGEMPVDQMPWAFVLQDVTSAANSGIGQSPTGMVEGTTVYGHFLDGDNMQVPMITGTIAGFDSGEGFDGGFKDPNGVYPRDPGENDVNRLARNERIGETNVQKKRDGVDQASTAFGGQWTEPATKYAAEYPYNHVRESESGHVEEFDDTPGSERISLWHKAGTFDEVAPDGTKVTKVVKDRYSITAGDDRVLIKGNCYITVQGNASLYILGNSEIEVEGNVKETIHGNYEMTVDGNFDVQVGGHHYENSDTHRKIVSPRIDWNP